MADSQESTWMLVDVVDRECVMDDSGFYTVIHHIPMDGPGEYIAHHVRCCIMRTSDNEPMMSYRGSVAAVRKAAIDWFAINARNTFDRDKAADGQDTRISAEHASYIGAELQRAALQPDFIQD